MIWVALVAFTGATFPSLSSEVNNNNSQFLPATTPSSRAATLATPILGSVDSTSEITIVAARARSSVSASDQEAIGRVMKIVRSLPKVKSVRELGVSADGHALQIGVRVGVSRTDVTDQKVLIERVRGAIAGAHSPPGLTLKLAGAVATNVANQVSSEKTGQQTQMLSLVFIIVLLLVIFRSFLAPLITLLPAGLSLLVSMRLIGELGAHGLKISEITELLLIILILGAGTDYGLFLVFRVREEIRAGHSGHAAVERALVRVGESISGSAGTVILALVTLLLASFGVYRELGIPLAIGVAVILLSGLTLLPALLAIFGGAAFWPARVKAGSDRDGAWGRIAARLLARPKVTLGAGVVLFAALAAGALGYHSSGFGGAAGAPKGSEAAQGNALVARHFPQSTANPANLIFRYRGPVWGHAGKLLEAESTLIGSGHFSALLGPLSANGRRLSPATYGRLHELLGNPRSLPASPPSGSDVPLVEYNAYRASAAFVSADGRTVQFQATLKAGGQQSTVALEATPTIRAVVARAARASGAVDSGLAGQAAALYDVSATSNRDLLTIVPIAIAAIALLLAVLLRSLLAPLYLIVSVAFSYLAALEFCTLVFMDIVGEPGLTFVLPFLMFIFLLALGEDYNILVMTRIREEARTMPLKDAVIRAVGRTGSTVTSAGLVLAGTFGVLAFAAGSSGSAGQVRAIGFGLAIGILMDTFVVRTLLVPATVALLGRWNWWPSRMSRPSHRADASRRAEPAATRPV